MAKFTFIFTKTILSVLILTMSIVSFPVPGISAAGLQDETNPPTARQDKIRIENVWARLQAIYQWEGNRLARADEFIARAQALIDRANARGWDTSLVQSALDAFASVIPAARAAHDTAAAIVADHDGFNPAGKMTDRAAAIETIKSLARVLRNTRLAMDGTGRALRQAIRDFHQEHHPTQSPATTSP